MKLSEIFAIVLVAGNPLKSSAWKPSLGRVMLRSARFSANYKIPHSYSTNAAVAENALEFPLSYFFEYDSNGSPVSQIECHLLHSAHINSLEYATGAPVDMPVALCYFEGNEMKQVERGSKMFPALFEHVQAELDENELLLFDTPVVMTLQGEFEDENLNNINPIGLGHVADGNRAEDETEEEGEEVTVSELIATEGIEEGLDEPGDDEFDDEEEDDQEEEEEAREQEFIYSSASGIVERYNGKSRFNLRMCSHYNAVIPLPRIETGLHSVDLNPIINRNNIDDLSHIPAHLNNLFGNFGQRCGPMTELAEGRSRIDMSDADELIFRRGHRRASRIMSHAKDVALVGSYWFRGKTYHLVRMLEPVLVIGKRNLPNSLGAKNTRHFRLLENPTEVSQVSNGCFLITVLF